MERRAAVVDIDAGRRQGNGTRAPSLAAVLNINVQVARRDRLPTAGLRPTVHPPPSICYGDVLSCPVYTRLTLS